MERREPAAAFDWHRDADREHLTFASYAMHSRDSTGRVHPEPTHPYRGPFARDRDRILHSSAFRRLSGKMQVFTGEMGVYHRTRLTHTFEVASVARTLARALWLHEDLTEALALLHDIGHPPYGHCGEDVLEECLRQEGGFSHNGFALVLATELEQRYDRFPGLNLSHETLAGQDVRAHKAEAAYGRSPLLEVQLVDAADSIAYDAHDVDDAIQLGLLSVDELAELSVVRRSLERLRFKHGGSHPNRLRQALVHDLIDLQVGDLLEQTADRLRRLQGRTAAELCDEGFRVGHSATLSRERNELEAFLFDAVYRHPRLMTVRRSAGDRLRFLFATLIDAPERLPLRFRMRVADTGSYRAVGDYLAGMTDAFCDQQYANARDSQSGPLADW